MIFLQLFDKYIEYYATAINKRDKRDPDTLRTYRSRGEHIGEFLMLNGMLDLQANNFRPALADQFFEHLSKEGYKHNYALRSVGMCKTVIRFGVRRELINHNPLAEYTIEKERPKEPVHLTPDELLRVFKMRPAIDCLKKARDMFLFQCLTGFDYGDTCSFSLQHIEQHFNEKLIVKTRDKTGGQSIVPIKNEVIAILERNKYSMALLCNQRYNKYLKSIAAFCKIKKNLTSHVGRKTYAMIELNYNSTSIAAVSRHLGHNFISTTENTYAKTNIMAVITDLREKERNNTMRFS